MAPIPGHPGYYLAEDGRLWNPLLKGFTLAQINKTSGWRFIKIYTGNKRYRYALKRLEEKMFWRYNPTCITYQEFVG